MVLISAHSKWLLQLSRLVVSLSLSHIYNGLVWSTALQRVISLFGLVRPLNHKDWVWSSIPLHAAVIQYFWSGLVHTPSIYKDWVW
jgi:hypothetical protein